MDFIATCNCLHNATKTVRKSQLSNVQQYKILQTRSSAPLYQYDHPDTHHWFHFVQINSIRS